MSRKRRKSRDGFESTFQGMASPMLVLILAIGAGMGVTALILNPFAKREDELSSSRDLTESYEPAERQTPKSADSEAAIETRSAPISAPAPRLSAPKAKKSPLVKVKRPRMAAPRVIAKAPRPQPKVIAQAPVAPKPAPRVVEEESRTITRVSTVTVERVIQPKPQKPVNVVVHDSQSMEDLSEMVVPPPAPEIEEEDLVFENVSDVPAAPVQKAAPVEREVKAKVKAAPKKIAQVKESKGPESFKDRLKKSREETDDEVIPAQAATRSFQDRLRKSTK